MNRRPAPVHYHQVSSDSSTILRGSMPWTHTAKTQLRIKDGAQLSQLMVFTDGGGGSGGGGGVCSRMPRGGLLEHTPPPPPPTIEVGSQTCIISSFFFSLTPFTSLP
eukprot:gene25965-biopygen12369